MSAIATPPHASQALPAAPADAVRTASLSTASAAIPTTRCVGAFLRPCDNQTAVILCADCYDLVERTLGQNRRSLVAQAGLDISRAANTMTMRRDENMVSPRVDSGSASLV